MSLCLGFLLGCVLMLLHKGSGGRLGAWGQAAQAVWTAHVAHPREVRAIVEATGLALHDPGIATPALALLATAWGATRRRLVAGRPT